MCDRCEQWQKQAEHWRRVADKEAEESSREWSTLVRQLRLRIRRAEALIQQTPGV